MENFSIPRLLPGVGPSPGPPAGSGFGMGGIPGFVVVQRLLEKIGLDPSFLVTLGMSITLLTSLFPFVTFSIGSLTALTRFISANLVSSATIHSSDVTYLYIMRWLAAHKISTDCRLFCVTSRKNPQSYAVRRFSSYAPFGDGNRSCQEDEDEEDEACGEDDSLGPKLKFLPAPGLLYFWHLGRPIIIHRKLDLSYYTGDIPDETIVLTTIGRSPSFLREILSEARRDYLQAQSRKTMVYTLSPTPFAQKNWDQGRHRPSRDISTVIMPPQEKEFLLQDVKEYLNPVTMRWYAQRGLPYRRGYLFFGPPGTGKTSLSLALAGEFKLPLYILSLSTGSLTDETLTMLFVGLPRKCIVLLEDIDCAGVHRSGGNTDGWNDDDDDSSDYEDGGGGDKDDASSSDESEGKKPSRSKPTTASTTGSASGSSSSGGSKSTGANASGGSSNSSSNNSKRPRISVSFSGLLNAIDGVASHEGRILIMTTNHRERLDSALIRPGRVDVQIEFGYASKETLSEIFCELYKEIGERGSGGGPNSNGNSGAGPSVAGVSEKKRQQLSESAERDRVRRLAGSFAERIPANRFTPAEIQGFLMSYKGRPEKAMEKIDAWVQDRTRGEKDAKARAERRKARKENARAATAATPLGASFVSNTAVAAASSDAPLASNTAAAASSDASFATNTAVATTATATATTTTTAGTTALVERKDGTEETDASGIAVNTNGSSVNGGSAVIASSSERDLWARSLVSEAILQVLMAQVNPKVAAADHDPAAPRVNGIITSVQAPRAQGYNGYADEVADDGGGGGGRRKDLNGRGLVNGVNGMNGVINGGAGGGVNGGVNGGLNGSAKMSKRTTDGMAEAGGGG